MSNLIIKCPICDHDMSYDIYNTSNQETVYRCRHICCLSQYLSRISTLYLELSLNNELKSYSIPFIQNNNFLLLRGSCSHVKDNYTFVKIINTKNPTDICKINYFIPLDLNNTKQSSQKIFEKLIKLTPFS
jgi:hypothetical protein